MTPHRSPAAAATLPNDLILDILSRLPVWSVCRFRCVCNEWRALISDPAFAAEHRSRHAAGFVRPNSGGTVHDLQLMDMDGHVRRTTKGAAEMASTSDGDLICVNHGFGIYHVVDMVTGKVVADCPKQPHRWDIDWENHYIFGFGRAVTSRAYKVVCLNN
ncbi:hypothetical protein BRADI_3g02032v3, partial [Brachypodium distachyon]